MSLKKEIIFQKEIKPFKKRVFESFAIESAVFFIIIGYSFFIFRSVNTHTLFFVFIMVWYSIIIFSVVQLIRMHYKFELIKISLITFSDGTFTFHILKKEKLEIIEIRAENIKLFLRWAKASRTRIPVLSIFDEHKKIAVIYQTDTNNEPDQIEYNIRTYLEFLNKKN
jgi:hypothetical protein